MPMATKPHPRSVEATEYRRLYKTARWLRLRKSHLEREPLCVFCLITEDIEPATVVDHKKPHKGSLDLFYDPSNLQSLCAQHHNGAKQRIERGFRAVEIGLDGYPIDIG